MTIAEQVYVVTGKLPPEAQRELLDFAEFLRQKSTSHSNSAIPLSALRGGLEDSAAFAGSPAVLQERLRDEWD